MSVVTALIIGLFVGAFVGFFTAALCYMARSPE